MPTIRPQLKILNERLTIAKELLEKDKAFLEKKQQLIQSGADYAELSTFLNTYKGLLNAHELTELNKHLVTAAEKRVGDAKQVAEEQQRRGTSTEQSVQAKKKVKDEQVKAARGKEAALKAARAAAKQKALDGAKADKTFDQLEARRAQSSTLILLLTFSRLSPPSLTCSLPSSPPLARQDDFEKTEEETTAFIRSVKQIYADDKADAAKAKMAQSSQVHTCSHSEDCAHPPA